MPHDPTPALPDRRLRADLSGVLRADQPPAPHQPGRKHLRRLGRRQFSAPAPDQVPARLPRLDQRRRRLRSAPSSTPSTSPPAQKLDEELQADFDLALEQVERAARGLPGSGARGDGLRSRRRHRHPGAPGGGRGPPGRDRLGRQGFLSAHRPGISLLNPGRGGPAGVEEHWVDETQRLRAARRPSPPGHRLPRAGGRQLRQRARRARASATRARVAPARRIRRPRDPARARAARSPQKRRARSAAAVRRRKPGSRSELVTIRRCARCRSTSRPRGRAGARPRSAASRCSPGWSSIRWRQAARRRRARAPSGAARPPRHERGRRAASRPWPGDSPLATRRRPRRSGRHHRDDWSALLPELVARAARGTARWPRHRDRARLSRTTPSSSGSRSRLSRAACGTCRSPIAARGRRAGGAGAGRRNLPAARPIQRCAPLADLLRGPRGAEGRAQPQVRLAGAAAGGRRARGRRRTTRCWRASCSIRAAARTASTCWRSTSWAGRSGATPMLREGEGARFRSPRCRSKRRGATARRSATVLAPAGALRAAARAEPALQPLLDDDRDAAGRRCSSTWNGPASRSTRRLQAARPRARHRPRAARGGDLRGGRRTEFNLNSPEAARHDPVREAAAPGPQEDQDRPVHRRRSAGAARGAWDTRCRG